MSSKKINIIFFSLLIVVPFTVFGVMHWVSNNYTSLPYYGGMQETKDGKDEEFTVPAFSFTNQDDQKISDDFVKGKIWIADYFFTSCSSICPKVSSHLKTIQDAFKNDDNLKLISFTVDPEKDSATVLKHYATRYNANETQWQFATGNKKDLYAFARKGLFIIATDGDGGENDFIHSENLVLVDAHKHIRGYYDGTNDTQVQQLLKDIQRLKKEN